MAGDELSKVQLRRAQVARMLDRLEIVLETAESSDVLGVASAYSGLCSLDFSLQLQERLAVSGDEKVEAAVARRFGGGAAS